MEKIRQIYKSIEKKVRKRKDQFLLFIVKGFDFLNIKPFWVSVIGLIFGLSAAFVLFKGKENLFLILICLKILFDGLDGTLARYKKSASKEGRLIDYSFDRIVTIAVMAAVILVKDNEIFYSIPLIIYLLIQVLYYSNREKLMILYIDGLYYLLIFFDKFVASVYHIVLSSISLFVFSFLVFFGKKKSP